MSELVRTECPACGTEFSTRGDGVERRPNAQVVEPEDLDEMIDMKIYLAGPVQNFESHDWRQDVKRDFPQFEFIDPMDWSDIPGVPTNVDGVPTAEAAITPEEVRKKCEVDLKESDALFAYKPQDVKSDGTAMEIRMADAEYEIPVAVCAGSPDVVGSFLSSHIGFVGDTFEECLDWLKLRA